MTSFFESDELSEIESTNVAHSYSESHQISLHSGCTMAFQTDRTQTYDENLRWRMVYQENEFYVAILSLVQTQKF